MGFLSSMYSGISGLGAQAEAMSVYGDNIANSNTVGFKSSRPEFQDVIIEKSIQSLMGGNQIGSGVKMAHVNPIFSQGSILQTDSPTDLSITGDGFFILDGFDGKAYSRNGVFHFDREGKLVNSNNYRVLGFQTDEAGHVTSKLGNISVDRNVINAQKTNEVKLYMNLDLRTDTLLQFDPKRPDSTSHFSTGVTVYDTAGNSHVCSLYFNKLPDGAWEWRAMVKGDELLNGISGEVMECANGKLTFDFDGRLKDQIIERSSFNFNKGVIPDQYIRFDFGLDKTHGGSGMQATQYGTQSEAYKTVQDGYTAGNLTALSFNDEGMLTGLYSNGENLALAQIGLIRFENPEGLLKVGQNRFRETRSSGQGTIGTPQSGGRGRITSKTIEASNTDIATEFINLMQSQRSFQANSKLISTADELLQDVLNLKRG